MTPDEEWGDVVWRPHWPLELCPDTSEIHSMQHQRPLNPGLPSETPEIFQCLNCYRWFDADESPGFFAAAARMGELVNKHRN